jgi:hypothetical protein
MSELALAKQTHESPSGNEYGCRHVINSSANHEHELDAYRMSNEYYLYDPFGIHGLGHASRVLVWANLIGHWMRRQNVEVDLEVIRWAATLHDIRRIKMMAKIRYMAFDAATGSKKSLTRCLTL